MTDKATPTKQNTEPRRQSDKRRQGTDEPRKAARPNEQPQKPENVDDSAGVSPRPPADS